MRLRDCPTGHAYPSTCGGSGIRFCGFCGKGADCAGCESCGSPVPAREIEDDGELYGAVSVVRRFAEQQKKGTR